MNHGLALALILFVSLQNGCVKSTPGEESTAGDSSASTEDLGPGAADMTVIGRDATGARPDGAVNPADAQSMRDAAQSRDLAPPIGGDAAAPDATPPPGPSCGNAAPEGEEECDDGQDTAECDGDCTRPSCGDGYWNEAAGEACDDGAESADCNADCTLVRCGDGIINELAGETCDDGNVEHLDRCSPTCQTVDVGPCNAECVLDNTYSVFEPVHRHSFQEQRSEHITLFGTSVAQNQRWTLVGRDALAGRGLPLREGVFVYGRDDDGAWDLGTFLGVEPEFPIQFGRHTALDQDTILVGAWGDRPNGTPSGAAYIYEFVDQGWQQTARVLPEAPLAGMLFGRGVCLRLPYAFVGAMNEMHDAGTGTVTIFRRNAGGDWQQIQKLVPRAGESGGFFGYAMDSDGERLVVWLNGNGLLVNPDPVAHIYRLEDDGRWTLEAVLREPGDFSAREVGTSVAIRGDTVLVGGVIRPPNGEPRGAVLVYHRDARNEWSYATTLLSDEDDVWIGFGDAVSLGDGFAVIGSRNTLRQVDAPGTAYVFERLPDDTWVRRGRFFAPNIDGSWAFGVSVSVNGHRVVVGATGQGMVEAPNQGRAHVYDLWRPICHRDGGCFCRPGFVGDLCADPAP